MSVQDTLEKWDLIVSQVPYRLESKESKAIVHMPVAHPDRTEDGKDKFLTCPGITWADLHELVEYTRRLREERQ